MQTIKQAELHLLDVTTERSVCQGALEKAKASVVSYFTKDGTFSPPPPGSKHLPTVLPSLPTTVSTSRSRCSAPTTPYSPAQCTFSHRGSVQYLDYAASPFPGR